MKIGAKYKLPVKIPDRGTVYRTFKLTDVTEHGLFCFTRKGNKAVCYSLFEIRQMIAKGDIR